MPTAVSDLEVKPKPKTINIANRKPDTVVFIHGLWMTPLSWENWVERYTDKG